MKEDYLHYIWKTSRFRHQKLTTTDGEPITILELGQHNTNAGPDFLGAQIKIGDILWAGNVEMHISASEWTKHGHHQDLAYNNVILHVVLNEDVDILRKGKQKIPCLDLRPYLPDQMTGKYLKLMQSKAWIPCYGHFPAVNKLIKNLWADRLLVERLERKTAEILEILALSQNDWQAAFYRFLARSFGGKVNNDAFEMLASSLPINVLSKHKGDLFQLEALLFGQAGMLSQNFKDIYPRQMKREYEALQKKYLLMPVPLSIWKYLRLRPANFPTIRIAQFAALTEQSAHLFSKVLETDNLIDLFNLFQVTSSEYWESRYRFDKLAHKPIKRLGKTMIYSLIINTVVPFIFLYGKQRDDAALKEKALRFLSEVPPERNHLIQGWQKLGERFDSAQKTQAFLQLKLAYCDQQRCMECSIGNAIMTKEYALTKKRNITHIQGFP